MHSNAEEEELKKEVRSDISKFKALRIRFELDNILLDAKS